MNGWEMAGRAAAVFVILLIWSRILGKKLVSQMTFFDFVAGITMGDIGGIIILDRSLSLKTGAIPLSVFCGMAFLAGWIALKSVRARGILNSKPTPVIRQGQILENAMAKVRLTMDDLQMLLRKKDVFYVDEVELAYLETDGSLSVQKKPEFMPASRRDLRVPAAARGEPRAVIVDGTVMSSALEAAGKDLEWLRRSLKRQGVEDVRDVSLAQIDGSDRLHVDLKKDPLLH
ncbi:DUF421 domain-containing protein [Cohnella caldifontis]|uniref:DUF421 domain-containing protein n=1 Tax=Cohnella caldifontis TaxID=3027471 RepID=UPI0023EB5300|nr:DUF421 domain-containing protein [Cohnella sp. YIM B05605]